MRWSQGKTLCKRAPHVVPKAASTLSTAGLLQDLVTFLGRSDPPIARSVASILRERTISLDQSGVRLSILVQKSGCLCECCCLRNSIDIFCRAMATFIAALGCIMKPHSKHVCILSTHLALCRCGCPCQLSTLVCVNTCLRGSRMRKQVCDSINAARAFALAAVAPKQ